MALGLACCGDGTGVCSTVFPVLEPFTAGAHADWEKNFSGYRFPNDVTFEGGVMIHDPTALPPYPLGIQRNIAFVTEDSPITVETRWKLEAPQSVSRGARRSRMLFKLMLDRQDEDSYSFSPLTFDPDLFALQRWWDQNTGPFYSFVTNAGVRAFIPSTINTFETIKMVFTWDKSGTSFANSWFIDITVDGDSIGGIGVPAVDVGGHNQCEYRIQLWGVYEKFSPFLPGGPGPAGWVYENRPREHFYDYINVTL